MNLTYLTLLKLEITKDVEATFIFVINIFNVSKNNYEFTVFKH